MNQIQEDFSKFWNVSEIDKMALAPCHTFFQFYVSMENYHVTLSKSADFFLGVPFNIASMHY